MGMRASEQQEYGVTLRWIESVGPLPIVQDQFIEQRFLIPAETREQAIEKAETACPVSPFEVRSVTGPSRACVV